MVKKNIKYKTHKNQPDHTRVKHTKQTTTQSFGLVAIVLGVALIISVFTGGFRYLPWNNADTCSVDLTESDTTSLTTTTMSGVDKPVLDLYVMSKCPYGVKVENELEPIMDQIGDSFDLNINYIVTDTGAGKFSSLHGQTEVDGNKAQICAKEHSQNNEYLDMIFCMNKNPQAIPGNWESCAAEAGIDVQAVKTCYEGEEANTLLSASAKKSNQAGATGSPTILLNGQQFGRSGATTTSDFLRGICNALEEKPDACTEIPECAADQDCLQPGKIGVCESPGTAASKCVYTDPIKFKVYVINDKLCTNCDTVQAIQTSQQLFPGVEPVEYDYEDSEAKSLLDEVGLNILPAYIFESAVAETPHFADVERHFVKSGNYYYLRPTSVASTHNPTAEICDNGVDDRDADGLVDCADDECSNQLICRDEIDNKLEVFVMSQCPFGTQALDAMQEVIENMGDQIDFSVNYIANENPDGTFSSLHGPAEVDEDIRELCVTKYYPENYKYMDYIWCRNKNIKSDDWEPCAVDGIDSEVIRTCSEGDEGKQLLSENIKLANSLGIAASPTWMANNKFKFSGIDSETVKANLCTYNDQLNNCDVTLSETTGAPAGSCN